MGSSVFDIWLIFLKVLTFYLVYWKKSSFKIQIETDLNKTLVHNGYLPSVYYYHCLHCYHYCILKVKIILEELGNNYFFTCTSTILIMVLYAYIYIHIYIDKPYRTFAITKDIITYIYYNTSSFRLHVCFLLSLIFIQVS